MLSLVLVLKMGMVTSSKLLDNGKMLLRISLEESEVIALKNHVRNVHVFAGDLCNNEVNLIRKGKSGVTKYFGIPFSLRTKNQKHAGEGSCQKLETDSKVFFVYVVNRKNHLDNV